MHAEQAAHLAYQQRVRKELGNTKRYVSFLLFNPDLALSPLPKDRAGSSLDWTLGALAV